MGNCTGTGFLRLRNERTGQVEKSVRVFQGFESPAHEWHNHGITLMWKVYNAVKAKTTFFLQGLGSHAGCVGIQNDADGWANTVVIPVEDAEISSKVAGAQLFQLPEGRVALPNIPAPVFNGFGWPLTGPRTGWYMLYGTFAVVSDQC